MNCLYCKHAEQFEPQGDWNKFLSASLCTDHILSSEFQPSIEWYKKIHYTTKSLYWQWLERRLRLTFGRLKKWFSIPKLTVQAGVKMLYWSMFPISSEAMSRTLSHCSEGCMNDWKSQTTFNFLNVWSDIIPVDQRNWKSPMWSWKSSVKPFPTCIHSTLCVFFISSYTTFIYKKKKQ